MLTFLLHLIWLWLHKRTIAFADVSPIKGVFSSVAANFLDVRNTFPKLGFIINPFTGFIIPKQGSILPKRGSIIPKRGSSFPKRGSIIPKRDSIFHKRGFVFALECNIVIKACTFSCWRQQHWWNTWRHLLKPLIRPDWLALRKLWHTEKVILEKFIRKVKKVNVHTPNSLRSYWKRFPLAQCIKDTISHKTHVRVVDLFFGLSCNVPLALWRSLAWWPRIRRARGYNKVNKKTGNLC